MLDRFTYEVYIPSIDDSIRFYELCNTHYISIQKYIQNSDDVGLQEYFKYIISRLSTVDIAHSMNRVDMFCILAGIRIYSIGDDLNISTTLDGIKARGGLSIDSIRNTITNHTRYFKISSAPITSDIEIELTLPCDLYYDSVSHFMYDCLRSVTINNNTHDIKSYTPSQKSNIIDYLPSHSYNIISKYIDNLSTSYPVFSVSNRDEIPIYINITDNTMYDLIKLMYTDDLKSVYDTMYILNGRIDIESYSKMTPGESNIFIANYIREQEQLRKQQETESYNIPSIGQGI